MQIIESLFWFAVAIIAVNFIIGILQEYCPEALPQNLRKKVIQLKTFETTIFYEGAFGIKTHKESMTATSLERMEYAVLDELNKKKFISLGKGSLIPTTSIAEVKIKEVIVFDENETGEEAV